MEYVDANGDPAALTPPVPFFTMVDDVVTGTDPNMSWSLEIERHPDAASLYSRRSTSRGDRGRGCRGVDVDRSRGTVA